MRLEKTKLEIMKGFKSTIMDENKEFGKENKN